MAFTVEDGSVVTDANAYISVSYADTFHSDRGNTDWTGTDTIKEAAIIKATDYIDQNYDFIGTLVDVEQSLKWPRYVFEQPIGWIICLNTCRPIRLKRCVLKWLSRWKRKDLVHL